MPFTLVSAEGRTLRLTVEAGGPPCDEIKPVEVDETSEAVTVKVHAGPRPDAQCNGTTAALGTFPVTVRLREPLGGRELR